MPEGFVPWPADAANRYRKAGYWRGRPLGDYLHEWAETYGNAEAISDGSERLTYRQLARRADGLAVRLIEAGLQPGDSMLVQLPNCCMFAVLLLACLRAGIAPVLALPAHRGREMRYLAAHARVTAVAVPDQLGHFDHQELGRQTVAATETARCLLVSGSKPGPGAPRPGSTSRPRLSRRARAQERADRRLPDLRRNYGTAQADHPNARRLRVQRPA